MQVMGVRHLRDGLEPVPVIGADMAVIGIIGTAPGANPAIFPYDDPVELRSDDTTMLQALGTTGTLADAVATISLQLKQSAAKIVAVRINPGADTAATITAILGAEATRTGMWALLDSPDNLGITPRIIIIPGFTSQVENGVASIAVSNGGAGYTADFPVTATGGSGTGFTGTAHVANGIITDIEVTNPGKGYATVPTLVLTAGAGTGGAAAATLGSVANQICANIPTILSRLKAKFIPEGPTSSRAAWLSWLESLPRDMNILHPLRQDGKISVNGSIVTKPLSPWIAGLYARVDFENGGIPSHSVANQSLNGLVGLSPQIPLDITNDSTIGMSDIEAHGGIVVRGEAGTDGSLSDGGFIFWGTDTLDASEQWMFANVVRMRDYVEINQIKAERSYLGAQNITIQTVQAVVNTMESMLAKLQRENHIIGFKVAFDPDDNNPDDLRLGWLKITFYMEEPAPLRLLTIRSRRYRQALTDLVTDIAVQLGTLTAA
jgi:phage tail sheath protein FI